MNIKKEYTYNDISLFSREISNIKSRFDENIKLRNKIKFGSDIIETGFLMSAPMFDVTGLEMTIKLLNEGEIPITHRFMTVEEQIETFDKVLHRTHYNPKYIYPFTVGVNDSNEKIERLDGYLRTLASCKLNILICIDTANGSSNLLDPTIDKINELTYKFGNKHNIEIMAGNVVTKEGCAYLWSRGVKFVRCGISAGSVCSTSVVTGIFRPPVSMLLEIAEWKRKNKFDDFYIIADGGIKGTDDMLKAIACGADFVMSGRLFAGYEESNSPLLVFDQNGNLVTNTMNINTTNVMTYSVDGTLVSSSYSLLTTYHYKKYYRGMASMEMAELNNKVNNIKKDIIPEGVSDMVPYKYDLTNDLNLIRNSIRSSMSYANSYNFDEYRESVEMVEISQSSNQLRRPDIHKL